MRKIYSFGIGFMLAAVVFLGFHASASSGGWLRQLIRQELEQAVKEELQSQDDVVGSNISPLPTFIGNSLQLFGAGLISSASSTFTKGLNVTGNLSVSSTLLIGNLKISSSNSSSTISNSSSTLLTGPINIVSGNPTSTLRVIAQGVTSTLFVSTTASNLGSRIIIIPVGGSDAGVCVQMYVSGTLTIGQLIPAAWEGVACPKNEQ